MITKYTSRFEDDIKTASEFSRAARDKSEQNEVSDKSTKIWIDAREPSIAEMQKLQTSANRSPPAFGQTQPDPWSTYNKAPAVPQSFAIHGGPENPPQPGSPAQFLGPCPRTTLGF